MSILLFLLVGLIAGAIARLLVPGRQSMGLLKTMGLGCLGSLLAGMVGQFIFHRELAITTSGIIGSVIGAVVVLLFAVRSGRVRS